MTAAVQTVSGPFRLISANRTMLWTGRVMRTLVVLFLIFDSSIKILELPVVAETMTALGWPAELGWTIGLLELVVLVLYAIPRTAVLGAILLTGVLGGAIATHVRVGDPLLTHGLFGVYLGVMAWGGLWFRDGRLRALLPVAR